MSKIEEDKFIRNLVTTDNQQMWQDFYSKYDDYMLMVINTIVKRQSDLGDIAQEVRIHIWKRLGYYQPGLSKFTTWLSKVIKNKVFDILKKQNKYALVGLHEYTCEISDDDTVNSKYYKKWRKHIINLSLKQVSTKVRKQNLRCINMYLNGSSTSEICEELRIKTDHAYKIKQRMTERLQKEILVFKDY